MLIADRAAETWIWESIPKEGKKQLRKIWARQARERKLKLPSEKKKSKIVQNITYNINDSVITGDVVNKVEYYSDGKESE
jgi:hypothetical protein